MPALPWLVLPVSLLGLAVGLHNAWSLKRIMSEQDDLNAGVAAALAADADIMAELSVISGELTPAAADLSAALASGNSASLKAAATAAAQALTANAAKVEAAVAAAKGADPNAPKPLAVSPATINFGAGAPSSELITITGGTEPYSVTGLPAGVTYAGGDLVGDATTVAGTTTATVADSSSPAETTEITIVIT